MSDVDLVAHTLYDLSFKYFLGMDPLETELINPATLSKFRRKRLINDSLLMALLGKTIEIAKELNLISSKSMIVDATHTPLNTILKVLSRYWVMHLECLEN